MPRSSTTWKPGQSGNPAGRPTSPLKVRPVSIALRTLITQLTEDGERSERIANRLLDAMETGVVELRGGKQMDMSTKEWLELTKWTLKHMEGNLRAVNVEQEIIEIEATPIEPEYEDEQDEYNDSYPYYQDVPVNTYVDPLKQEYLDWFKQEWKQAQAEGRDDVPPYKEGTTDINWEMWDRWGALRKAKWAAEQAQEPQPSAEADQERQKSAPVLDPNSSDVGYSAMTAQPVTESNTFATPGIRILRRGGGAAAEMEAHTERLRAFFSAT